ncbi:TPA: suppressor of Ty 5 homolog [Bos taurus]|nr:TPA: suppressor of Ty 5 homolog [Bos taurus]
MSDSEDSNFSEEEDSERSSDGEEAEVEEERRSAAGSEKEEEPEEEEEEEEEEEYDEEEEEEDDDRPPKKPRHGGFILDEADVDDEYEDEDQWEDGAEDILEKEEIEASNPQTPGYPDPSSPQVNPQYNPQTPGTPAMYNTDQFSPYAAPSPQGSYQPSPSPQSYHQVAPSPAGYQNTHSPASYHPTPSPMAYQASPSPSPVGYSPMTPGAPSPGGYNPHTPGSGIEQNSSDWVTTDIQVKVRDTYLDTQVVGQTGVIRSVTGGMCSVYLKDSEKVVSISSEHLEPITPTKNNKVKVILGEDREATGVLLSIDGEDGIVRMDLDE